ncbi:Anaphase-promoting complex, subunit CDC26 [Phytophthora cinnamomi]|uniref:Anaphase-promoting complex, subunit CDC26 n=1 Tax=Phytophthora cinnamomi TaxID=4785 RepID=UPI00355A1465|nr:Anaphase-promoting complex, subunit CDC26 [Phytophthora cinnamomi]
MLRRQPTRVEERADVAAEYEAYLQEKERKGKTQIGGSSSSKTSPQQPATTFESMAARQEARRQDVRARIGLDVHSSN